MDKDLLNFGRIDAAELDEKLARILPPFVRARQDELPALLEKMAESR